MNIPDQKELDVRFLNEDVLLPFQIETGVLRGRFVRLGASIDAILRRHAYPDPVASLLAQTAALAAALGSALKFDGVFTLQAVGDGPLSMLVADVTSDGALRACAKFDEKRLVSGLSGRELLGKGTLVFTVDQKLGERYQGVVALEGNSLTDAFQTYFKRSEQIPTGLMAAAGKDAEGGWHAGCLMIQKMPREGGAAPVVSGDSSVEDDWLRTMTLMQSCTQPEMIDPALPPEDLLFRLFHEEGVRVYDKKAFREECRCSREKLLAVLKSMSQGEREDMLVNGCAEATCHFCGRTYTFDEKEIS